MAIQKTSRSDFKLSDSIQRQFVSWEQSNGISFWNESDDVGRRGNYGNVVSSLYHNVREAGTVYRIFRRFSTVSLYTPAEKVTRRRGLERLGPAIFEHLVDLVQKGGTSETSRETIATNLRNDIAAGSKYRIYGTELGGLGSLFHLPESVTDYT